MCQCACEICRAWIKCSITMVALRSQHLRTLCGREHHQRPSPAVVTKYLQILVHNVSSHDGVDNKLTKRPLVRRWRRVARQSYCPLRGPSRSTEFCSATLLFLYTLQAWSSQVELGVGHTSMVGVVDECRENTSELRQGVGRDTVRVIMKCRRHICPPSPMSGATMRDRA
jgi:hypothetical protein